MKIIQMDITIQRRESIMNVYQVIEQLIKRACSLRFIEREDGIYIRNQILHLLHLERFEKQESKAEEKEITDLLEDLVQYASEQGIIDDYSYNRNILASQIMNCFMSKPSTINQCFYQYYECHPEHATDYFYELSRISNYIQTKHVQKNISYKANTEYGELDVTINVSKPEKDPKEIVKENVIQNTDYPKCLLCIENEGYVGRIDHPARSNHRMIRMELLGERWYLQYSPYVYYNEHCIVLAETHRNMEINRQAFERLLSFVKQFPHYFIGSNADLPIVGGSILSHDHYQGGKYEFAMAKAEDDYVFQLDRFSGVQCSVVKWPMSVIRLKGKDSNLLVNVAESILDKWKQYSDSSVHIYASTDGVPHNTITPIARKRNKQYELDLVLRNNRTSEKYPFGIFHPHQDVQHIKKENVGLIEVMGLAVLPARLKLELQEVERYVLYQDNSVAEYHKRWAEQLRERYKKEANEGDIHDIVQKELAAKFLRALEDAGVFKRNDEGIAAFKRFIQSLEEPKIGI